MDISQIRRRITQLAKRLRQEGRNSPETWVQMQVLSTIDRLGSAATPSKVATEEKMQSSNLAPVLRELESAELITKVQDTTDRRRTWIHLTPQGQAALQKSRDQRDGWLNDAITACLTEDEQKKLDEIMPLFEKLSRYEKVSDDVG